MVIEILEIALLARTLHQAEALRRLRGEGRYLQLDGIRQLPKYVLAGSGGDLQAVGIVNLGPIVIEMSAIGFIEQEHRGERRDADDAHFGAREQREFHVRQRLDAGLHGEAVGAGGRVALEQGVDHDRGGARGRAARSKNA